MEAVLWRRVQVVAITIVFEDILSQLYCSYASSNTDEALFHPHNHRLSTIQSGLASCSWWFPTGNNLRECNWPVIASREEWKSHHVSRVRRPELDSARRLSQLVSPVSGWVQSILEPASSLHKTVYDWFVLKACNNLTSKCTHMHTQKRIYLDLAKVSRKLRLYRPELHSRMPTTNLVWTNFPV